MLSLLAERPRHGYEIIKAVTARSSGTYRPSSGMVYPALTDLVRSGHATCREDGARKLYGPSESGRQHLTQNQSRVGELWEVLRRNRGRTPESDSQDQVQGTQYTLESEDGFDLIVRDVKAALFDALSASPEERARVALILSDAIARILAK